MYKVTIAEGVVMGRFMASQLLEGEYEVTQEQFLTLKLPCRVQIVDGAPIFGEVVSMEELPAPEYVPSAVGEPTAEAVLEEVVE